MALSPKDMFATRFMEEKLIELYQSSMLETTKKSTIQLESPSSINKSDMVDFGVLDVCYPEYLPKFIKEGLSFTMEFNIKHDRTSYSYREIMRSGHKQYQERNVSMLAEMIVRGVDDVIRKRLFVPSENVSFGDRRNDFTIDVSHNTMDDEIAIVIRGPKSAFEELPTGIQWLFTAWNAVKQNKRIECIMELLKMMLNTPSISIGGTVTGRMSSKAQLHARNYGKTQKLP